MLDQYFGTKEIYELTLRAKTPMKFGSRYIEEDEPVLYFENIAMSNLTERSSAIMARGGWANMPRVIWEDRSEIKFELAEGIMSSISMSILLSANVGEKTKAKPLYVPRREGPFELDDNHRLYLDHWPVDYPEKKTFIFDYDRDTIQKKLYGKKIHGVMDPLDRSTEMPCLEVYEDKNLTIPASLKKEYLVDYYYYYGDEREALIYSIHKERFNGLFSLEGKFYSKDETEGLNYTNLLYMPKVRIVSDINLRLGERADPTVAGFSIIGLPESTPVSKSLLLEISRLDSDVDEDVI